MTIKETHNTFKNHIDDMSVFGALCGTCMLQDMLCSNLNAREACSCTTCLPALLFALNFKSGSCKRIPPTGPCKRDHKIAMSQAAGTAVEIDLLDMLPGSEFLGYMHEGCGTCKPLVAFSCFTQELHLEKLC